MIEIIRGLLALRRCGRLPAIWVERGRILLDAGYGCRRPIGWRQAERLAAGEPLEAVLAAPPPAVTTPKRRPASDWQARRAEYLARRAG
jgi:hypothetical protein